MAIGTLEREVMRVTFEADTLLPVESVAAMVGCSLSRVYSTYVKYGVSIPRKNGVHKPFPGKALDAEVEKARVEKIRKSVTEQHAEGKKRACVEKLQSGAREAHLRGAYFGRNQTAETRAKISRGVVSAFAEGRLVPTGYRSKGFIYDGIRMRSGLEAEFARQLDEAELSWVYEPRMFKLSWCTYVPDFYLPELDIWVECKGWMSEISARKVASFREETGLTLSVVWYTEVFGIKVKSHGRFERVNS